MLLRAYRDGTVPLDADGWFATGDAGAIGADGRLVVHGRLSDLIISGGENVWPAAVEAVLRRHPGVAEVAVAGRPDPEWGERVVAWVVPVDAGGAPDLGRPPSTGQGAAGALGRPPAACRGGFAPQDLARQGPPRSPGRARGLTP